MLRDHWREFARELASVDEIPPALREALGPHLPAHEDTIHLFLIPQPRGFWDWFRDNPPRNSVFILSQDHRITVASERSDGVDLSSCAVDNVMAMEVGTVLLNSWVTLTHSEAGHSDQVRLEYGTVFERTFRSAVLWMRAMNVPDPQLPPRHLWRMPGEEYVQALPLKFNNAARNYWLDGETAVDACFVAPLTVRGPVLRRIHLAYSTATAVVLSDFELLIIKEAGSNGPGRWGQTWHFCPLSKIKAMEITASEPYPQLRVRLAHNASLGRLDSEKSLAEIAVPFPPEQRAEMDRILSRTLRLAETLSVV